MLKSTVSNPYAKPVITVVIPSYNQEKTISRTLESVLNQDTSLKYEVIVVDSSTNEAAKIVKSYVPKIKLIHSKKRLLPGAARNIGIKEARGEIIAFTDTDCVVDKDWLTNLHKAHDKNIIAGGKISNGNPGNLLGWSLFLTEFGEFTNDKSRFVQNIPSCNISYKKRIFGKYGLFPEDYYPGEDYAFNSRIKEKMFYSDKIVVKHINRTSLRDIFRHAFKLGYTDSIARRNSDLPGKFLLKYTFLIPLISFYKFFVIAYRSMRAHYFIIFLMISPIIFLLSITWNLGFLKGALN